MQALRHDHRSLGPDTRQEHRELASTDSTDGIASLHVSAQKLCNVLQYRVACRRTVGSSVGGDTINVDFQ